MQRKRFMSLRLLGFAVLATVVHFGVMELTLVTQGWPYLFWPSLLVRFAALILAAPMFAIESLMDLNYRIVLPMEPIFVVCYLVFFYLFERLKAVWKTLEAPPVPGRRTLLLGTSAVAVGTVALCQGARELIVREEALTLADLPPGLEGLKVCLLSDLHRGPSTSKEFLQEVIDQVKLHEPDVILLPGDFISKSAHYLKDVEELLVQLNPSIGSFATLGNHDHWEGAEKTLETLERVGIHTLQNKQLMIDEQRRVVARADKGLCVAGVDDYWVGKPNLSDALRSTPETVPVILLSHNPDVAELETEESYRVDLQVSGHTHGGQILLPGLGPVATASRFGTKYLSGWAQGPRWRVYTTVGIGTSMVPVRVGTTPEIIVFKLRSETSA